MNDFDPYARERALKAESLAWETDQVELARPGDIPVIDLGRYLTSGDSAELEALAETLRHACEEIGFFSITGHQVPVELIEATFRQVKQFHGLPLDEKLAVRMDRPEWPHGGMGYLPVKNSKLPARDKVNFNEAFLVKADHRISLDDNQWPDVAAAPDFRATTTAYAQALTRLARSMLPVFARALDVESDYFDEAFKSPLYRLRMTHYPPMGPDGADEFGINPHVDTTFFTILAQDAPGLAIYSAQRDTWIGVPMLENAFVVNTGELLRQWTNDRFLSTRHFATNNTDATSRYSIPFFFNANPDYIMECVPTCFDEDNPPKYPAVSYSQSQAIAQGE